MSSESSRFVSIVSWEAPSRVEIEPLRRAVAEVGLDPNILRSMLPRNAFARARRYLEREHARIVRVVDDTDIELVVQFTEEVYVPSQTGNHLVYNQEAIVRIDKASGRVTGRNPQLVERLEKMLAAQIGHRTCSDITRLLKRLFRMKDSSQNTNALVPFNRGGYTYVVPHVGSAEQKIQTVETLLGRIGGRLCRLTLDLNHQRNAMEILGMIDSEMENRIGCIRAEIEQMLSDGVSKDRLSTGLQTVQSLSQHVDLFGQFLSERAGRMREELTEVARSLNERLTTVRLIEDGQDPTAR